MPPATITGAPAIFPASRHFGSQQRSRWAISELTSTSARWYASCFDSESIEVSMPHSRAIFDLSSSSFSWSFLLFSPSPSAVAAAWIRRIASLPPIFATRRPSCDTRSTRFFASDLPSSSLNERCSSSRFSIDRTFCTTPHWLHTRSPPRASLSKLVELHVGLRHRA